MSISVIPVKFSPQVKSAPSPLLPLHHPCPLLRMYVLSHPYSLPTLESLHIIRIEHWFTTTSKILSTTSTSRLPHGVWPRHQLIKAFFPPPLCFLPLPLPKSQSGLSVWTEQILATLPLLTHTAEWHSSICWTGWKWSDVGDDANGPWVQRQLY